MVDLSGFSVFDAYALARLIEQNDNKIDIARQWLTNTYAAGLEEGYEKGFAAARAEFQPRENEMGTADSYSGVDQEGRK